MRVVIAYLTVFGLGALFWLTLILWVTGCGELPTHPTRLDTREVSGRGSGGTETRDPAALLRVHRPTLCEATGICRVE